MKVKKFLPVLKKTGFIALEDVLVIDKDGEDFHATKRGRYFNLPIGSYWIEGDVQVMEQPFDQDIAFYPFERDDRPYHSIQVVKCNNPNKASVVFDNRIALVMIDHSIYKMPKVCLCYCYEHELAHAHYKQQPNENALAVENRCDAFAEHRMLERGFNPSQIKYANEALLKNDWRKCECETRMLNNFKR